MRTLAGLSAVAVLLALVALGVAFTRPALRTKTVTIVEKGLRGPSGPTGPRGRQGPRGGHGLAGIPGIAPDTSSLDSRIAVFETALCGSNVVTDLSYDANGNPNWLNARISC